MLFPSILSPSFSLASCNIWIHGFRCRGSQWSQAECAAHLLSIQVSVQVSGWHLHRRKVQHLAAHGTEKKAWVTVLTRMLSLGHPRQPRLCVCLFFSLTSSAGSCRFVETPLHGKYTPFCDIRKQNEWMDPWMAPPRTPPPWNDARGNMEHRKVQSRRHPRDPSRKEGAILPVWGRAEGDPICDCPSIHVHVGQCS